MTDRTPSLRSPSLRFYLIDRAQAATLVRVRLIGAPVSCVFWTHLNISASKEVKCKHLQRFAHRSRIQVTYTTFPMFAPEINCRRSETGHEKSNVRRLLLSSASSILARSSLRRRVPFLLSFFVFIVSAHRYYYTRSPLQFSRHRVQLEMQNNKGARRSRSRVCRSVFHEWPTRLRRTWGTRARTSHDERQQVYCIRRRSARARPCEQLRGWQQQGCETPYQGGDGAEIKVDRRSHGSADHTDALHRDRRTGECGRKERRERVVLGISWILKHTKVSIPLIHFYWWKRL